MVTLMCNVAIAQNIHNHQTSHSRTYALYKSYQTSQNKINTVHVLFKVERLFSSPDTFFSPFTVCKEWTTMMQCASLTLGSSIVQVMSQPGHFFFMLIQAEGIQRCTVGSFFSPLFLSLLQQCPALRLLSGGIYQTINNAKCTWKRFGIHLWLCIYIGIFFLF